MELWLDYKMFGSSKQRVRVAERIVTCETLRHDLNYLAGHFNNLSVRLL